MVQTQWRHRQPVIHRQQLERQTQPWKTVSRKKRSRLRWALEFRIRIFFELTNFEKIALNTCSACSDRSDPHTCTAHILHSLSMFRRNSAPNSHLQGSLSLLREDDQTTKSAQQPFARLALLAPRNLTKMIKPQKSCNPYASKLSKHYIQQSCRSKSPYMHIRRRPCDPFVPARRKKTTQALFRICPLFLSNLTCIPE